MTDYPHRPPSVEVQTWAGDFSSTSGISLEGSAVYDTGTVYGTSPRSIRLQSLYDLAYLPSFPVDEDGVYLVSVMHRTERNPGASIILWGAEYPSGDNYNINPEMINNEAHVWQESLYMFQARPGVTSHRFRVQRVEDQKKSGHTPGHVWIGDVRVYRVNTSSQPWGRTAPGNRIAFDGTHVKVSDTGDWSINDGSGNFEPFLPLIAHPDYTDLGNIDKYAGQGFTAVTQISFTSHAGIAAAAGLKYFLDIGRFCLPGASEYGNSSWLNSKLAEFANASHVDSCIGFYCDYENGSEHEHDKQVELYAAVKSHFGDSRPIWINDQSSARARKYNDLGDVVGCYCNPWTTPWKSNMQGELGSAQTLIAQPGVECPIGPMVVNLPHETTNVADEMMRAFCMGAKSFSLFADRTNWDYGLAFHERPWFNQIAAINQLFKQYREVINTVPWTDWTIEHDKPYGERGVTVSGRDLPDGRRAVMMSAQNGYPGGDVTFTVSFGKVGDVKDYLTDAIVTSSDDNTFTVNLSSESVAVVYFSAEEEKGTLDNPFVADHDGGRQSFNVLNGLPEGTVLLGVGDLVAGAQSKEGFGHYMNIGASYGLGVEGRMAQNKANLQALCTMADSDDFQGALVHFNWRDLESSKGVYNGFQFAHFQELLDIARPYGKKLYPDVDEIRFVANNLTLDDTPVPQYIIDEGRVTYSGNPHSQAICSKIATDPICQGYFINLIKAFAQWDNDPAFGGILLPETSRSWSNTPGGPYNNIDDGMIDLYIALCEQVKAVMPKSYVGPNLNFTEGGNTKIRELVDKMEELGGCIYGSPDMIAKRDPLNSTSGDYYYQHYSLMREYRNRVPMGPDMHTKDIGTDEENCWSLVSGPNYNDPLDPNFVFHFDWHPIYGASWKQMVFDAVRSRNAYINNQKPTADNYNNGVIGQSGTHPQHATAVKNNQNADLTPTTAQPGDTDTVSIFVRYPDDTDEEIIRHFLYADVGTDPDPDPDPGNQTYEGTITNYEHYRYELGTGQYTIAGTHSTRKWIPNNQYGSNSFSPHIAPNTPYLLAGGGNGGVPSTDVGDRQRIPLDHLTPGQQYRVFILAMGSDASSDSVWALVNGEDPVQHADTQLENSLWGDWYYQFIRKPDDTERYVTSDDNYIDFTVREPDLHLVRVVIVDARETTDPTGIYGYISAANLAQDDTFNIAKDSQEVSLPVLDNDTDLAEIVDFPDYPQNATVVRSNDLREIVITPDVGFTGAITFSYRAKKQGEEFLYVGNVVVNVVDSLPPVAGDVELTLNVGDPFVINFDDYISSPDSHSLSIDIPPTSDDYNITNIGNTYTFVSITPDPPAANGTYRIVDALGSRATGNWSVTWVVPHNDPPEPVLDQVTTTSGTPVVIKPLDNDIDPQAHELTIIGVSDVDHGTVTFDDKNIVYTPPENFTGIEVITYEVKDRPGLTAEGTINVVVTPEQGEGVRTGGVTTAKVRIIDD